MRDRLKQALIMVTVLGLLCACVAFSGRPLPTVFDHPAARLSASSGMPVLSIITADHLLPGDEKTAGEMHIYSVHGSQLRCDTVQIEINERGNTSKRFPKKSYRVSIIDEKGEKKNISIAGLRKDDDWILNPMYTDTSKIREPLAYALWDVINTSGTSAQSTRVQHAEVYLNGEYWGLYGVQERIDRKQVNADKRAGVLYKVFANRRPSVEELLSCTDAEICGGFKLAYAGAQVENPWAPAAAYMALLDGGDSGVDAKLSLENTIDYGLWAMLVQAHDCHFKNQFIHCVPDGGGYTMYRMPWDVNHTFGDAWNGDAAAANFSDYYLGKLVQDGAFARLLASDDPAVYTAIAARWTQLRSNGVTEENLLRMAHDLYFPLWDALERDSERWPECGMGNGNARNIRDIEHFIRDILPRMDEYIASLVS